MSAVSSTDVEIPNYVNKIVNIKDETIFIFRLVSNEI